MQPSKGEPRDSLDLPVQAHTLGTKESALERVLDSAALPHLLQTLTAPSIVALRSTTRSTCIAIDKHLLRHITLNIVTTEKSSAKCFLLSSPLGLPLPGFRPIDSPRGKFAHPAPDDYNWHGHPRRRMLLSYTKFIDWHAVALTEAAEYKVILELMRRAPSPNHVLYNLPNASLRMQRTHAMSMHALLMSFLTMESTVHRLEWTLELELDWHGQLQPYELPVKSPRIVLTATYSLVDGRSAGHFRIPPTSTGKHKPEVVVLHLIPSREPVTDELARMRAAIEAGGRAQAPSHILSQLVQIQSFPAKRLILVGFAEAHAFLGYDSPAGVINKFQAFNDKIDSGEYKGCKFDVLTTEEYIAEVGTETYEFEVGTWHAGATWHAGETWDVGP